MLENFYDRNLNEYYKALQMGHHSNYYFGRNNADITQWLEYFLEGLAEVYTQAALIVQEKNKELLHVEPELIRKLDLQQKQLFLHLAFKQDEITHTEIMFLLKVGDRTAREKVKQWIDEGFLEPKNPHAQRVHSVVLTDWYEDLADEIRNNPDQYKYLLV